MRPIRSLIPFAYSPRSSINLVAFVAMELDFAPNRVLGLIRSIPSVVNTVWRIASLGMVSCKCYLGGSNYNYCQSQKRVRHRIGEVSEIAGDVIAAFFFQGLI